jgi:hypothetical protein
MDLFRLIVTHVAAGTSVALGMALIPVAGWLIARWQRP